MQVSIVEQTAAYQIKLIEFYNPSGDIVTSFFQAINLPSTSLGAFDSIQAARQALGVTVRDSPPTNFALIFNNQSRGRTTKSKIYQPRPSVKSQNH